MHTDYTKVDTQEEEVFPGTSEKERPFHWWPPGFLEEDDPGALFSPSSQEDGEKERGNEGEDEREAIFDRLSHAFRVIDKQSRELHELAVEIQRLEKELEQARGAAARVTEQYRRGLRWVTGSLGVAGVLYFHREICQVGWNGFRWIMDALNLPPEDVIGFLTAAAAGWLFWKAAGWICRSAMEEFLGEGGEKDDLGDR